MVFLASIYYYEFFSSLLWTFCCRRMWVMIFMVISEYTCDVIYWCLTISRCSLFARLLEFFQFHSPPWSYLLHPHNYGSLEYLHQAIESNKIYGVLEFNHYNIILFNLHLHWMKRLIKFNWKQYAVEISI